MTDDDSQLEAHHVQLTTLGAELDKQRASYQNRHSASNSRAALLIGSAALASGVQATSISNAWQVLAIAATLVAAVGGILSLWPRRDPDLNVRPFFDTLYSRGQAELERALFVTKLRAHEKDEAALIRNQRLLRAGFVALAVAIAFTGLQAAGVQITLEHHPTQGEQHNGR